MQSITISYMYSLQLHLTCIFYPIHLQIFRCEDVPHGITIDTNDGRGPYFYIYLDYCVWPASVQESVMNILVFITAAS